MEKINKNMTILEVVQKCPEAGEILMQTGMHCIVCHMAGQETLEQGLKAHGMNDKQVEEVVKKINAKIK